MPDFTGVFGSYYENLFVLFYIPFLLVLFFGRACAQLCGMALQGIDTFCGDANESGLINIQYAPTAWIDADTFERIISSAWNWQVDVDFTEGGWLTASLFPNRSLWREDQRRSDQGKYYDQEVRGVRPNLKPEVSGELDEMAQYRYLLKIEDIEGRPWILGTLESPFDFEAGGTTGESGSLKHHIMRWVSQTPHKAYGFVPVL